MFGVLFIPDHFEDLVLCHFLNVFLELNPAECVEDTPESLDQNRKLT